MYLVWLQFIIATIMILAVSGFLAKSADVIAFKTGLGRTFVGVLLLASATSLPELATGISSVTAVGAPDLAAGDAFGSNLVNLLIIGLMDIRWHKGPLLNSVSINLTLVAVLSILIISIPVIAISAHHAGNIFSTWIISPFSIFLLLAFMFSLYLIFRNERNSGDDDGDGNYENETLFKSSAIYVFSATVIVCSAIWLAFTGEEIAKEMGWEASFVGTQFLALSTSLPELAASFAALRILAPELAISNVLGSNLFNMGFVLWADDLAQPTESFWAVVSQTHVATASIAIAMTAVVIIGLVSRNRSRPSKFLTYESVALIALYLLSNFMIFKLG
ncbi:MAG: sodium:calcium antiporter [Dehalococcoidia bacterium]|nr:sodium:calcium antiporter [Dehalococcoidia bacterium]